MKPFTQLFISLLFIGFFHHSLAQTEQEQIEIPKIRFGVGLNGAFTTANASLLGTYGIGATAFLEKPIKNHVCLGARIDFSSFNRLTIAHSFTSKKLRFIPLSIDGKYFLNQKNTGFYLGVGAGFNFYRLENVIPSSNLEPIVFLTEGTSLLLLPEIGYRTKNVGIQARYIHNIGSAIDVNGTIEMTLAFTFGYK